MDTVLAQFVMSKAGKKILKDVSAAVLEAEKAGLRSKVRDNAIEKLVAASTPAEAARDPQSAGYAWSLKFPGLSLMSMQFFRTLWVALFRVGPWFGYELPKHSKFHVVKGREHILTRCCHPWCPPLASYIFRLHPNPVDAILDSNVSPRISFQK